MFKFISVLFSKMAAWFRLAMLKGRQFLKKEIPLAIAVVDALKRFVESPLTPIINEMIPGEADDIAAEQLRIWLPKVLVTLRISDQCVNLGSNDAMLQCIVARLRELPKADRRGIYLELASKLSEFLVDSKLSWAEIVVLVQTAYDLQNPKK